MMIDDDDDDDDGLMLMACAYLRRMDAKTILAFYQSFSFPP